MNKIQPMTPETRVATSMAIKELCKQWLEYERSLNMSEDTFDKSLWFNLLTLNVLSIDAVAQTLTKSTGDQFILLRLSQLYLDIVLTFGKDVVEQLHSEMKDTIVKLNPAIYTDNNQSIKSYEVYRATYPFIVIIPFLNTLKMSILKNSSVT